MTEALPHAYPFRFVDTVTAPADGDFAGGRVRARVSANGRAAMGEGWQSPLLYAEAIAQAALLLRGDDPERGKSGFLAGIEGFTAERSPIAGETLDVTVRLAGRFGLVVRFDGEVASGSETLARASVLVREGTRRGDAAPEARAGRSPERGFGTGQDAAGSEDSSGSR